MSQKIQTRVDLHYRSDILPTVIPGYKGGGEYYVASSVEEIYNTLVAMNAKEALYGRPEFFTGRLDADQKILSIEEFIAKIFEEKFIPETLKKQK